MANPAGGLGTKISARMCGAEGTVDENAHSEARNRIASSVAYFGVIGRSQPSIVVAIRRPKSSPRGWAGRGTAQRQVGGGGAEGTAVIGK